MHGVGGFEVEIEQPPGARDIEPATGFQDRAADFVCLRDRVSDGAVMVADDFNDLFLREVQELIDSLDSLPAQLIALAPLYAREQDQVFLFRGALVAVETPRRTTRIGRPFRFGDYAAVAQRFP